jgi:outer membrane protein assembly factor BamB
VHDVTAVALVGDAVLVHPASGNLLQAYGRLDVTTGERADAALWVGATRTSQGYAHTAAVPVGTALLTYGSNIDGLAPAGTQVREFETGVTRWTLDEAAVPAVTHPVGVAQLVFVLPETDTQPARVARVDPDNGAHLWRTALDGPVAHVFDTNGRWILVQTSREVPGEPGRFLALHPDTGARVWEVPMNGRYAHFAADADRDGVLVRGLDVVQYLDAATGAPRWRDPIPFLMDGAPPGVALLPDVAVYLRPDRTLVAHDRSPGGAVRWRRADARFDRLQRFGV